MRAVITVIDPAAVITGAVTQDNHKQEGNRVALDTQTHAHVAFGFKDGGEAVLQPNVCKHCTGQSRVLAGDEMGGFKNKQSSKLKADQLQ